jgi:hypothetical protein
MAAESAAVVAYPSGPRVGGMLRRMGDLFDDRIESWAADFAASPEAGPFPPRVRDRSQDLLAEFLGGACEAGTDPSQIGEAEVRAGLVGRVAGLGLDAETRAAAPDLVAAFLRMLGRQGRVAGGPGLAAFARALAPAFRAARGGGATAPIRREAPKLGPNDPCPCGSGRKWKKCCRATLGGG